MGIITSPGRSQHTARCAKHCLSDVTDCAEPLALASNCHFMAEDFWVRYNKAKETGVFYFWGHSYEMFRYDEMWDHFEAKIRYITEDPDTEWANVIDIVPLLTKKA